MRKLLKRLVEWVVAWGQRKMSEDTISEKESERILREIEKMVEENRVNSKVMVSEIKWQTEEPKEMGMYLATLRSGKVAVVEFFHYTVAGMEFTDCVPYGISKVVACCKLDSIEPYKA